jgi:hypothetical protein
MALAEKPFIGNTAFTSAYVCRAVSESFFVVASWLSRHLECCKPVEMPLSDTDLTSTGAQLV